jgi:glycosyltransferase involved in cell wall biosynthesis
VKILHVIVRLAEVDGGPPHGLVTLAKAQAALGDDITILPCSSTGGKPLVGPGQYGRLTVLEAPTDSSLKFPNKVLKNALLDLVKNFDIVHIHGSWRYHLVSASYAARRYGIPYIVRPAGNLGTVPRGHKAQIKMPYFWLIDRPIMRKAAAIHCCTIKESNEIRPLNIGTEIFILPNPVDDTLVGLETKPEILQALCPGLQPHDKMLLYIGRITPIKQLEGLLKAFCSLYKKFRDAHLVLAGPWEDKELVGYLQSCIKDNLLEDKVHMPGAVQDLAKAALLRRATVFVQPSKHENFGLSAAEALLFGKTCVVSEGVALADELVYAGAGIKYAGDVGELTSVLERILVDDDFRKVCEQNAKELADNFKPDFIAKKMKQFYEMCITR